MADVVIKPSIPKKLRSFISKWSQYEPYHTMVKMKLPIVVGKTPLCEVRPKQTFVTHFCFLTFDFFFYLLELLRLLFIREKKK